MQENTQKPLGKSISLTSNFFRFESLPIGTVYNYFIEYTPEVEVTNKDLQKILVRNARPQILLNLGDYFFYEWIISTVKKEEPFTVTAKGRDSTEYILKIRFVSVIEPTSFHFFWYLNVLIKLQQRNLGLKQLTSKPNFFDSSQAIELKSLGLNIWNGYKASVNMIGPHTLMTLDICSKIINTKNVLEAIEEVRERTPELRRKKISEMLENQIVMTLYNKRFYRVQKVDFDSDPNTTFISKEGEISIKDYYIKQYQIKIKNLRQPLLVSVQKNTELKVVPELCFLTGIPEHVRRNGNFMRQVRDGNKSNPNDRILAISKHAEKMNSQGRDFSTSQNLLLSPTPIQIQAVELNPIKIQLKNESLDCYDKGFSIRSPFKATSPIALLRICHDSYDYNNANYLESTLKNRMRSTGVSLEKVDFYEYSSGQKLCSHIEALKNVADAPKIIVIILQKRDRTYEEIKQISANIDIPVQCMLSSQFKNDRKIDSILTNIAHQIAAKTGSQLWTIPHIEGIPRVTMVVGIDVYHSTPSKKESILAFSASLNPEFTKYYSTIRKQAKIGEEIASAAESCFNEALVTFFEETKKRFLPNLIVVFRDGVSDNQLDLVRDIEISGLRRVISKFQGYNPEIVYVIVVKRIDQRFFLSANGTNANPRPGTYVSDPQICDESTFYLISSGANLGTATPVKYKIIENTSNIGRDVIAKFSYGLCHLYYNWKGPIKLPCPIQLSHKLAYVVGESVHKDVSTNLKKTLWFL